MKSNLNFIDRIVNYFSPSLGTKRMAYRFTQQQVRRYEAAGHGRRTDNWRANLTSAQAEINVALVTLRNRSRDLVRNNGYAKNAVRKIANNVVGAGIIPNPKISSAPQEKKLKVLWNAWANSSDCDFDGHLTFYGIQKLIMRTVVESGGCFVRRRITKNKNLSLPLQLQVLEPDFLDLTKYDQGLPNGGYILYGAEFDINNRIVAYWLYETHPGDNTGRFNFKSNRFPVEDVIYVFEKDRPGQFLGIPWLHAAMLRLKDLDEYEDAQLIRQKIAACFSVFITDSGIPIGNIATKEDDLLEKVEPGMIEKLKPGQTVSFASPPQAEGYAEYTRTILRSIAASAGMDYVTLTGDLTATNFSSGRMGWLEFNRNVTEWQWQMLIPMHCNKAWQWFIDIASIYGYIRPNVPIAVDWTPPRREQINPEVETKAMIEGMQNGVTTWTDIQLEQGFNPDEQLEKMQKDKVAFEKAGLPFYTSKPAMTVKETAQAAPASANTPE
jgi:lambda family phage portal protein